MAINYATYYSGRWTAASTSYPLGEAKNRTTSTSQDGSYVEKTLYNAWTHNSASVISSMGQSVNGSEDVVGDSQYFRALKSLATGGALIHTDGGSPNAYVLTPLYGEGQELVNGVRCAFVAANTSTSASTVNVNGNGTQTLVNYDGDTVSDEIQSGDIVEIIYDGTSEWRIISTRKATNSTVGEVRFATDTEASNQSNVAAAVMPDQIAMAFAPAAVGASTQSVILPNGLIMKFGVFTESSSETDYKTWDEDFPNGVLCMQATPNDFSGSQQAGGIAVPNGNGSFAVKFGDEYGSTQTGYVFAIGY